MAQKPGELNNIDRLDPVSTTAGAGSDPFLEKYAEDYPETENERREMTVNTGEHPEETEQIKARIEETRSQMGETIDAIQEKLSFSNVSEQVSEHVSNAIETAKDSIYDATIGKAVHFMKNAGDGISNSTAVRTVQKNPLPIVLIGLGAGLLAYQSFSKSSSSRGGYQRRKYINGRDKSQDLSTFKSAQGNTGSFSDKAYESVSSTATSAYENVSGAFSTAYDGANDFAHRAYDTAGEYKTKAYDTYEHYIEENPIAVGAIALAAGAAVGFAIPSTRYEGQLMGETRQNLLQKAQDAAGDLVDKAKNVATEAGKTIKEETNAALNPPPSAL